MRSFVWCALFAVAAPHTKADDAVALFHKMQAALGGAEKIAAVRSFEQIVEAEAVDGNTGQRIGAVRKRTRWLRPSDLRIDQIGPGSTYVFYFDGNSGWEILPGSHEVIPISGGELVFAQGYIRGFKWNIWLADRDPHWQISSVGPNVLRLSDGEPSHQIDITLDPATHLPARLETLSLSDPAHPVRGEEVITAWETVNGLRVIHHWTVLRAGTLVGEATAEVTRINGDFTRDALAAEPRDLEPVFGP